MKKFTIVFSIMLVSSLLLTACGSPQPAQAPQPQAQPTEAPAQPAGTEAPAGAPTAAAQPAAPAAPSGPQHTDVPGDLPTAGEKHWTDLNSKSSAGQPKRALTGDNFYKGSFERPYNANTMDTYFPNFDISDVSVFPGDSTWVYAVITVVGRDANNALPGQFALELDLNRDGRGDLLVLASNPASTDWTTDGVQVFKDGNADIGGVRPYLSDSGGAASDGYEAVVFDNGQGTDPDAAWVRLSGSDPQVQFAFKKSLLGDSSKYLLSAWAAAAALEPGKFDLDDHYTWDVAGAADPATTQFYPIKSLAELDNTCRYPIGYDATGLEPGVCAGR